MTAYDESPDRPDERGGRPPAPPAPPAGPDSAPGLVPVARGVLTSPTSAFRGIARQEPVGQAFAVVVVSFALSQLVQGLVVTVDPQAPAGEALATALGGLLLGIPGGLVFFLLWAAGIWLVARMLGGSGGFRATLCGLGFAYLPLVVGAVVAALALPLGAAAATVVVVVTVAASLWSLVLDVVAVREIHVVGTGRALGAVLLTVLLFVVLAAVLVFGLFAALFTTV